MSHKVGDLLGEEGMTGYMFLGWVSKVTYDENKKRNVYEIDWVDEQNNGDIWSETDVNYFKIRLQEYLDRGGR